MKRYTMPNGMTIIELESGDLSAELYTHARPVGERYREPLRGRFWIEVSPVAVEILGRPGRLLSPSKEAYQLEHPGHKVWFNACVFNKRGTEVWFGDLDMNRDSPRLDELAKRIGVIYATRELPYRWTGLPAPGRRRAASIRRFA